MKKNLEINSNNNLNSIKFICALLVILHHSYPIVFGEKYIDPIRKITNLQFSFGNFSVIIFLFIAGMLITKSYLKSKGNIAFLKKRLKRLLPSLIIVIFLTVFIIGPIFTQLSLKSYFLNFDIYKYLIMNSLLITNHTLPVFLDNPYNLSPNGALWTLPVEFLCYIGTVILGLLKVLKSKLIKTLPFIVLFINIFQSIFIRYVGGLWSAIQAILFFLMGMSVYFYKDKIKLSIKFFIVSLLAIIISIIFNIYSYVNIILIPYIVIFVAFYPKKQNKTLNKFGNYSYEIYLLGFLVQQCVATVFTIKNPYFNFIISLPFVFELSFIVNKIVEYVNKKVLD